MQMDDARGAFGVWPKGLDRAKTPALPVLAHDLPWISGTPLDWEIFPDDHLAYLRTEGALRLSDVTAYLEAVRDAEAISFRKLCDAREGHSDMTEAELLWYLGAVKGFAAVAPLGPQALVVSNRSVRSHEPMLRMLFVNDDRRLQMFKEMDMARNWLELQPLPCEQ